jgi:hypothetical protein
VRPAEPALYLADEAPDDPVAHIDRMKAVVRQDIAVAYDKRCQGISVPDEAFFPVEITGGGLPELAVSLQLADCRLGRTLFSGTGGEVVQFWIGSGGPVRLLLEQQMHGFTPLDGGLQTVQHGGSCPGGAGPDSCVVTYRWEDKGRRLETESRTLGSALADPPEPEYGYYRLTGVKPPA